MLIYSNSNQNLNTKTHFFLLITGEATDEQPFVSNNDKSAQYDPNLYLYSVSI